MYHVPLLALLTRLGGSRHVRLGVGRYQKKDLPLVVGLIEAGKYRPVIDRTYRLDEVVEATRYVESGQKTGNVVLHVSGSPRSEHAPADRGGVKSSLLPHVR
jgi:NADPH:quinone reductase-like Zn-dependent oxidoreductase